MVALRFLGMSSITIKNIPESVHAALKQRAIQNGRSLNKEIVHCLEGLLMTTKRDVDAELVQLRNHRNWLPGKLTDDLLDQARKDRR